MNVFGGLFLNLFLKGVKPASFEKVQSAEIKDVIESCIRPRKEDRPKVKDLLTHAFFEEDFGLKVEVVSVAEHKVVFRLRVIDPKKRTHKHKENEAIQFEYDMETDRIDTIAEEMVSFSFICPNVKSRWPYSFVSSVRCHKLRFFLIESSCHF